ncbi:hypothetical protein RKU44_02730, partial [Streptococcus pneumoniae]|nr:hypothetical protein [Streptococcus pneumoniae]MDS4377146.1 hypothetical protein [Streptococcus pneumoniae]
KKHPLGEKRNHPGSKLRQGFWMVFRLGVNNWGIKVFKPIVKRKEKIWHKRFFCSVLVSIDYISILFLPSFLCENRKFFPPFLNTETTSFQNFNNFFLC